MGVVEEILLYKKQNGFQILAHYYEEGDIQDIADEIGDSLFLAQKGSQSDKQNIILAGVVFMGESVKLLAPHKRVFVPDVNAGCSLVHGSPEVKFRKWRESFEDAICVTYINSSVKVKALSDIICTSSNAEKIIASIPSGKKVLFAPDQNLGRYLIKKTGREMELWPGSCEVHVLFHAKELDKLIRQNPEAVVIAHPECNDGILSLSHVIGSTSRLLEEVRSNPAKKFIVATEEGILHQMKKVRPDAELIQAPTEAGCGCNQCPYMKLNTLEKILRILKEGVSSAAGTQKLLPEEIFIETEYFEKANLALERMMKVSRGEPIDWNSGISI
ncbi:MAG: quinolinate synthase [Bdellovibrionales bacterium CG10_big_fil_rev_8_21_14_0_10_45_34]|nr:MAG: quinolinate synthase [Bdellovibrionales bacterium CG10_big_fil_rev_8_21_14_0_10_45_34]